jgi:hypothetical protein
MIQAEWGVVTDGSYRPGYCLNNLYHNAVFAFVRFRVISCVTYDPGSWSPRNPDHTYASKPIYISFVGWRTSIWLGLAFAHRCCWHVGNSVLGLRRCYGGAVGAAACRDAAAAAGCGGGDAAGLWRIAAVRRGFFGGAATGLLLRPAGMMRRRAVADCRRPPGCGGGAAADCCLPP